MTTLGGRDLNRATLARQLLLRRAAPGTSAALTRLGGLQAQEAQSWCVGLWSRLAGYRPEQTSAELADAGIVRLALMRNTIHLVTARDARWLRPLLDPVIERGTTGAFGRHLRGVNRPALVTAARTALAGRPMMHRELGRALEAHFPGRDPAALGHAARAWLPLVQVPPRGLWGSRGRARHLPLDVWLGDSPTGRSATGDSDPTKQGRELFDLPDAPRPGPDTPAPVRFLYDYDNLLLSHADRSRAVDVDYTTQGFGHDTPEQPRSVLIDGFVGATGKPTVTRDRAVLTVRPFRPLTATERADVEAEGSALLSLPAPGRPAEVEVES